jgi:hypothetical protein
MVCAKQLISDKGVINKSFTSAYWWNRALTFKMPRVVVIQVY